MRVVSMVPSWTETLVECGINVVGRTRYCIHPSPQVKNIQIVGGTKDINWEKIRALKPDFLLLDQEENPKSFASEAGNISLVITHVKKISDMPVFCFELAQKFKNIKLKDVARRWSIIQSKEISNRTLDKVPGVMEWITPFGATDNIFVKKFIYLIWKDPWMAVSRDTFVGDMFFHLGLGDKMMEFEKPYPEIDLNCFNSQTTLLLFSSEPYPFEKKMTEIKNMPFPAALVNGESFTWFGIRSLKFLEENK
jgi:hypothetical protein